MKRPITISIFIFFIFYSCKQEVDSVEIEQEKHVEKTAPLKKDITNESKIIGLWTNGDSENATFEISEKSIYYVDDFKDYTYTLENDSIEIKYPDYVYRAKAIVKNDSLIMISKKFGEAKYWRFKE